MNKWVLFGILLIVISGIVYQLKVLDFVLLRSNKNSFGSPSTSLREDSVKPTLAPLVKSAPKRDAYTLLFVGDSMTKALGPDSTELRKNLKSFYPTTQFGIFNYSKGSTNILSVKDVLEKDTKLEDRQLQSVLSREFEVIFIESFGHNPLSEYTLADGLEKQTETLDWIVNTLREKKPNSIIVFLTPIAPSRENYAKNERELTQEKRNQWVNERIAYIENHRKYAKEHDVLLLDLFEKSKDEKGSGREDLIDKADYIHPSAEGVKFMSKELAEFLYKQKVLI